MSAFTFTPRAVRDIELAQDWYADKHPELGRRFVEAVQAAVTLAASLRESAREVRPGVWTARTKLFPYRIYYRCEPEQIVILAVYHTARDPQRWDEPHRS